MAGGEQTFVFTDIVDSTRLWDSQPDAMSTSLRVHDAVLRESIDAHSGEIFANPGDAFGAAFPSLPNALDAAAQALAGLRSADWGDGPALQIRIGAHSGDAERRDGNYFGTAINVASRVCGAAHAGQILATSVAGAQQHHQTRPLGSHRLKGLRDAIEIWQVGDGEFPPIRATGDVSTAAPQIIGREAEVERVAAAVLDARVVTLVGPGGIGKTTVAMHAASVLADDITGISRFVLLGEVGIGGDIVGPIAQVVGVSARVDGDRLLEVIDRVASDVSLLVLDNCEHVLEDVQSTVRTILERAPRTHVLATSRVPLRVPGEVTVPIAPLEMSDAVELFHRRAEAAGVQFSRTDRMVEELCARLDGFPLAVELVASRTRTVGLQDQLDRLVHDGDSWLRDDRRGTQRHRSMEAALGWSIDRLSEIEREVLTGCSLLDGDFDLAAVQRVVAPDAPDALEIIDGLTDQSMLQVRHAAGSARFRVLTPIRDHLRPHLDGVRAERLGRRLVDHYIDIAEGACWSILGRNPATGLQVLAAELPNLRTAADLADGLGEPVALTRLVRTLGRAELASGATGTATDLRRWIKRLEATVADPGVPGEAAAHEAVAWAWTGLGSYANAKEAIARADRARGAEPCSPSIDALRALMLYGTGEAIAAAEQFAEVDYEGIEPADRAFFAAMALVVAAAIDAPVDRFAAIASDAAEGVASPATTFWARYAAASAACKRGELDRAEVLFDHVAATLSGLGLSVLENQYRFGKAIRLGWIANRVDPAPLLAESMFGYRLGTPDFTMPLVLQLSALVLDRAGHSVPAARILGLLDEHGWELEALRAGRLALAAKVADDDELRRAHIDGGLRATAEIIAEADESLTSLTVEFT